MDKQLHSRLVLAVYQLGASGNTVEAGDAVAEVLAGLKAADLLLVPESDLIFLLNEVERTEVNWFRMGPICANAMASVQRKLKVLLGWVS